MVQIVAWVGIVGAAILFIVGLVDLITSWAETTAAKTVLKEAATQAKEASEKAAEITDSTKTDEEKKALKEYAGLDLSGNWEALAKLATALKDLDRSTRLFVLSLAFLAVSGATVGLDAIATGLGAK